MSEISDMAKGYGREWEVGTNGNLQILRTICLACVLHLIDFFFHFLLFFTGHRSRLQYTQRPPNMRFMSYLCPQHLRPTTPLTIAALNRFYRLQPKRPNRNLIVVPARSASWGKIASFGEKGGARPESANMDEETLVRYL